MIHQLIHCGLHPDKFENFDKWMIAVTEFITNAFTKKIEDDWKVFAGEFGLSNAHITMKLSDRKVSYDFEELLKLYNSLSEKEAVNN